ncbi:hypothetical protein HAX54_006075 [Datura stramonium]|uniref:Uncharacterized protein n=1 Tax=Datura stramonium TaxID=4076 RepID=A0ABS8WXF4_DATST|nr:hypothetical protein [Datura stramonium]
MNPNLKKRKWELVVAHDSKTDLGIGSQVEHTQVVEAQPSTSDTPSVTQSTQSIFAARMVQVANMTAWNKTRVSNLEGIGVREALAALQDDMSKVNTDVQQLQLDLSIFELPLPEDEVFEDERVKTDEKELEDDHVTKELDEE